MLDQGLPAFLQKVNLPETVFFPELSGDAGSRLIKPYLTRISRAAVIDWTTDDSFFAGQRVPYGLNSPAALVLGPHAVIKDHKSYGALAIKLPRRAAQIITPVDVIGRQEQLADFAFSFDFPIIPGISEKERNKRFRLSIANAAWMSENTRRRNLTAFAVIQGWDPDSYRRAARELSSLPFHGIAIGNLRRQFGGDGDSIRRIVDAVRAEVPTLAVHLFGGEPGTAAGLIEERLISSASAKLDQLLEPKAAVTPADVPKVICRLAALNRLPLPLSAYRLTGFL